MTDARDRAERLAAEKYPPVTVRGDDVFEAPRIAFMDGYLTRDTEDFDRWHAADLHRAEDYPEEVLEES